MSLIDLSICVTAVPQRAPQWIPLMMHLSEQIEEADRKELGLAELVIGNSPAAADVSAKRNALIAAARGRYLCFVDDDDWVADTYVWELLAAIAGPHSPCQPDVISFEGTRTVAGQPAEAGRMVWEVRENGTNTRDSDGTRHICANHICAVRADLARRCWFHPGILYNQSWTYTAMLISLGRVDHNGGLREVHIPRPLYQYQWSAAGTICQQPEAVAATRNARRRFCIWQRPGSADRRLWLSDGPPPKQPATISIYAPAPDGELEVDRVVWGRLDLLGAYELTAGGPKWL